jgi:hypothetical protein
MEKLNLTPQERRLVAGVLLIVFVFLNIWLVRPHFSDWRKIQIDREKAERTLARYQKEVDRLKLYQNRLRELENQGSSVVLEEQDIDLATMVQVQSTVSKVEITGNKDARSSSTQTNQFFDEKARTINYKADTEALVTFLTSLTTTNSMIRVRDMTVRPEPPVAPTRLSGDITLVASYQKKPVKPTANAATPPPPKTPAPNPTTKAVASAAKTNGVAKQGAASKPGSGPNVATNKSLPPTNTNKPAIPKPRSILPSLPKS